MKKQEKKSSKTYTVEDAKKAFAYIEIGYIYGIVKVPRKKHKG